MLNPFSLLTDYISKKLQRREMRKKGLVQSKKAKRLKQDDGIANAVEKSKVLGFTILLVVWGACITTPLLAPYDAMEFSPVLGQKAPATVRANFDFSYVDKQKTEQARKKAELDVPLTYDLDSNLCSGTLEKTDKILSLILVADKEAPRKKLSAKFPRAFAAYAKLTPSLASALKLTIQRQRSDIMTFLQSKLYQGVLPQTDPNAKERMVKIKRKGVTTLPQPAFLIPSKQKLVEEAAERAVAELAPENRAPIKHALETILSETVSGSLTFDAIATREDKKLAASKMSPVEIAVDQNSVIMRKGEVIDRKILARCDAYLKQKRMLASSDYLKEKLVVNAIISLFLIVVSGLYIKHVHPEVVASNQSMGLVAAVVIINIAVNFLTLDMFRRLASDLDLYNGAIFAAIPLALGAVLLSVTIGLRVALFAGLLISFLTALQLDNSLQVALIGMIVSAIAALATRHRRNYKSYFMASFASALLAMPLAALINFKALSAGSFEPIKDILMAGSANALVTASLALAILFVLEPLFQITSDMSLLVLCDYNHPLLKRLQLEAPGTYHHSLVVATLAEQAAEAIGANPIKARAVSLFHDIGKMEKPGYFTENQMEEESKHSNLNPTMSALVIINHVKDGVDMAIKHKLKKIIRDGIEQHHGTDIVTFFHQQALEEARLKGGSVDENDFRYPGPIPREREVAILSLADACEAASRSIQKPSPAKIDALVWEIIRKRIRSGQLDDANITFGELAKIRKSFAATLTTMMHGRIAYPKGEDEEKNEDYLFVAARERENKTGPKKTKNDGD